MKNNKKNAYKGYKRAHFYTMIGSIALGLCLIIATIIIVCCFSVEVKVETPATIITQTQPNNVVPETTTNSTDDNTKAIADDETNTDNNDVTDTTTDTTTPTENPVKEITEEDEAVEYSTLTVTVNIYTDVCKTKFVEITMPVGTTISIAQLKEMILNEFPTFNYARTVGIASSYTFTEEDYNLPGIVKISTLVVEATETTNDNQEITPVETEEPTTEIPTEAEAEATETVKDNQEVTPTETEEPAQAPTEIEPVEEPEVEPESTEEVIINTNNTSVLTVTVNIYTNICKTVFVNIEKPVGTTMARQEIKDYILSLYPGFDRVRATGTPESYTFVEEDGVLPGTIKID